MPTLQAQRTLQAEDLPVALRGMSVPPIDPSWIESRIGSLVGRSHRVVRHVAAGGMGQIFVVEHVELGAHAAVKLAAPNVPGAAASLAREARLLSRVHHPHIVHVFDYGHLPDGVDYLLMEYVSGVELHAWIESHGPMRTERALPVLRQLASAIDHLHANGIVHADVKPANVLFDPCAGDFCKLIDFGVAFFEDTRGQDRECTGTPAYMAPEQAAGHACSRSVDVYGLAALSFELVTGKLIREYTTRESALLAALNLLPALGQQGMWPAFQAVLSRALSDEPAARYRSAAAFMQDLEQALPHSRPSTPPGPG